MLDRMTVTAAAAFLGVSSQTLRRWDVSGKLVASRHPINNYRLYSRSALEHLRDEVLADPTRTSVPATTPTPTRGQEFVGRSKELTRLRALLARHRVATVVGPAGVGKTTLARQLARQRATHFLGGSFFCDLSECRTLGSLLANIAQSLSIPLLGQNNNDHSRQLARVFRSMAATLLVLDASEGVSDLADAVEEWISEAPELTIVLTSRSSSSGVGKSVELPPLDPNDGFALFEKGARRVFPTFEPAPQDCAAIREIVSRLDGIPLAIELAATRVDLLSPCEILERLDQRLLLLSKSPSPEGDRHASLRCALDSVWNQLKRNERSVLAQCSVFRGGFFLEAVEEVVRIDKSEEAIVDLLQSLRNRSLLCARLSRPDGGKMRLSLAESVRVYARERLNELGQESQAVNRHLTYYLGLAKQWRQPSSRSECLWLSSLLALNRDNILAIIDRCQGGRPALAARATLVLAELPDGVFEADLITQGIELAARAGDSHVELRLRIREGMRYLRLGHLDKARRCHDLIVLRAQQSDDGAAEALGRLGQAELLRFGGDVDASIKLNITALTIAREIRNQRIEALANVNLAKNYHSQGEMHLATGCFRKAYNLSKANAQAIEAGTYQSYLARMEACTDRQQESDQRYEEALAVLREIGDRYREGISQLHYGEFLLDSCRLDDAHDRLHSALALHRSIGDRGTEGAALFALAQLNLEEQELEKAATNCVRSMLRFREVGADMYVGLAKRLHGLISIADSNWSDAQAYFSEACEHLSSQSLRFCEVAVQAMQAMQGDLSSFAPLHEEANLGTDSGIESQELDLLTGFFHLALARTAAHEHNPEGVNTRLTAVESKIELSRGGGRRVDLGTSSSLRVLAALLQRSLREIYDEADRMLAAAGYTLEKGLLVGPRGQWFRVAGSERCILTRRPTLSPLFAALVDARVTYPGQPISKAKLIAAVWPGERHVSGSADSRLWVAIRELRNRGLRNILLHGSRGYYLDPDSTVRLL